MIRLRPPLIVLLLMLASSGLGSPSASSFPERLQEALDKGLRERDGIGVSAAVVFPDGKAWLCVSGRSYDTVPVTSDMLFAVGSITKNMVAVLTLQLVEEGRLSLEDPLQKWLPSYPHVAGSITIRQLLNHTSGLYMFWENQKIWDDLKKDRAKVWRPEDVLGYLQSPYFPPGKGHRYSNTNYLLLAMIITKLTGSPLSAELRRRFWEPLGLKSAYLAVEESAPGPLAHVWGDNFEGDGALKDLTFLPRAAHDSITYGSAGVFMTAEDLARWTQALFQGKVLGEASLAVILNFQGSGYRGLGVARFGGRFTNGRTAYGHSGGNIGTTAFMIHLPDVQASLAVMINTFDGQGVSAVTRDLIKVLSEDLPPSGPKPFRESRR